MVNKGLIFIPPSPNNKPYTREYEKQGSTEIKNVRWQLALLDSSTTNLSGLMTLNCSLSSGIYSGDISPYRTLIFLQRLLLKI